jgi:hypothetical protein
MKYYWKSATSGNFATAGNWSPSGPPGVFDQAILTATGAFYTVAATNDQTVLTVNTSADATLDIQGSTFTAEAGTGAGANNGTIDVEHGSTFAVAGTLNNSGTINLFGAGEAAYLQLVGDTTLKGGELHLFGYAEIDGNGTLTNSRNSTIDGAATIFVPLVNDATAVVDANGPQGIGLKGVVTNTGELLGESAAGLSIANIVYNTGGLIEANGGSVSLSTGAMIIGGTLDEEGGTFSVETASFDGAGAHPITLVGDIAVYTQLFIQGAFKNPNGSLDLKNGSSMLLGFSNAPGVDTTFSGHDQIVLTNANIDRNPLTDLGSSPLKLNNVDEVMIGSGQIGSAATQASFVVNNEKNGVIEAFGGSGLLIYSNVTNAGVLDATGGTMFLLSNVITNTLLVSNVITDVGSLKADSGATISLQNTTIHGGTLTGDGLFTVVGTTTFDGSAAPLNNQGNIELVEGVGSIAKLEGTINNTGTIEMGYYPGQGAYPGPYTTTLLIGATAKSTQVTLTGHGLVEMDYGYSDFIEGGADLAGGVPTTLNNLNNTIEGGGRIGDGGLTLKNSGTIAAGSFGSTLVIDTGERTVTNTGTLRSNFDSELYIDSPLNNTGGKLDLNRGEIVAARGATGGTASLFSGSLEFGGPTTTNVQFNDPSFYGSGLVLDDSVHFKGIISGFDKVSTSETIDLLDIDPATAHKVSFTGGALTIKDGLGHTAQLHFSGAYTINNFNLSNDGHGGTLLTDPPVAEQRAGNAPATIADGTVLEVKVSDSGTVTFAGPTGTLWLDRPSTFTGKVADFGAQESIDLSGTPFGAHTTLGYSENSSDTGGILSVKDGTHIAKLALLGNYMAASFVTASDGYGGTLITEGVQTAQQSLLTHPHA